MQPQMGGEQPNTEGFDLLDAQLESTMEHKSITLPELAEGETYAGLILNEDGTLSHHVVLLPGDNNDSDWQAQLDWAKSIGGDLPTKLEAAMLFANTKEEFQPAWYWTNETFIDPDDPEDTNYAWVQYFSNGDQDCYLKLNVFRSRAVRRLPI